MGRFLKLLSILSLLAVIACGVGRADQVTVTFGWQQDIPSPNDLKEWKLYKANVTGGPYAQIAVFPFTTVQTEYTGVVVVSYPAGQKTKYFYVLTSVDTSGNESGYSNEVSLELDYQAPAAPKNLKIK